MSIFDFIDNSYSFMNFWIAASLVVGLLFFFRHRDTRSVRRRAYASAIAGYTMFVLFLTVLGRNIGNRISYNLFMYEFNTHYILNCIMFLPIGYMLPRIRSYKSTIIMGFSLSCCIEFLQLFTRRGTFEIGDIIFNTLGAIIGCVLCYAWRLCKLKVRHHNSLRHHHHSHSHIYSVSHSRAWRSR